MVDQCHTQVYEDTLKNRHDLENEDNLKNEGDHKNGEDPEKEVNLKIKTTSKMRRNSK